MANPTYTSAADAPGSVDLEPSATEPRNAPSYIRELGVKPEQMKAVLVGASIAGAVAVLALVVASRARHRRRAAKTDTSSGVVGTILKSALFAAAQTYVKVKAARLAAQALHSNEEHAPIASEPAVVDAP